MWVILFPDQSISIEIASLFAFPINYVICISSANLVMTKFECWLRDTCWNKSLMVVEKISCRACANTVSSFLLDWYKKFLLVQKNIWPMRLFFLSCEQMKKICLHSKFVTIKLADDMPSTLGCSPDLTKNSGFCLSVFWIIEKIKLPSHFMSMP